jgi:large subunit ribosomal protein L33
LKEKCPKGAFFSRQYISLKIQKEQTMGIKGKNDKMVVLACEDCKERNYTTTKNKKTNKERMELKKFCSRCNRHTVHKETK